MLKVRGSERKGLSGAVQIHVPELGKPVVDSTAGKWLESEGDQVKAGEPLVELDKINFEVEAEEDGVLGFIRKGRGETANVEEATGTIRAADCAGGQ